MRRLADLAIPLLLLVAWECVVRFDLLPGLFFATPSGAARRLTEMAAAGELRATFAASLGRMAGVFLAGATPGLLVGLTLGLFHPIRTALRSLLITWYAVLKFALAPLLLLLLIPGELPSMVIIGAGLFILVAAGTLTGVIDIEQRYIDMASHFGASHLHFCLTVALPGALPQIFAVLRLGVGMALLLTVAAEIISAPSGIGALIRTGYSLMDLDGLFVGLLLMALLGLLFAGALTLLERKVVPWRR